MTSRVLLFEEPERFTVGTVGQPGERTFFIQARDRTRLISISLEKAQVQALSERLLYMVREIKQSDPTVVITKLQRDDAPLDTPIEEEFRVGVIGLAFDADKQLIQVDLQAVSEIESDNPEFIDVDDLTGDQDICAFSSHHLKLIALANVATQLLALAVNPVHSVVVR